jgi:hypothetical protein
MRHLVLGALFAAACSSEGGTGPGDPAAVQLSAPQTAVVVAEAVQLSWQVKDAQGATLANEPVTFASSSVSVLTVTGGGLVTGVGPGTAVVTGKAGSATGQLSFAVNEGGLVTAAGGTVSGLGGAIELVVPPGALSAATAIRLLASTNPLLDPTVVVGSVYTVGAETVSFAVPATLRVRFNPGAGPVGLPVTKFRLRRFDGAAWVGLPNGSADAGASRAEASLSAGGIVSVGWAAPAAPCTSPEERQFDFWLGSWTVTENGQSGGLSDITVVPGGCAILEHFRSGVVGRSISFYEASVDKWFQTYVDDAGNRLLLAGRFQNGGMDLLTPPAGGVRHGRTRWTPEGDNVRQQVDALSTDGGATYAQPRYNFVYLRR